MARDVDLLSYLPDFMQKYAEIRQIMVVENTNVQRLENDVEQLKLNQFIQKCDSDGIKRYENVMQITSVPSESLESRRMRVYMRWNDTLPYTYRNLLIRLESLCTEGFSIATDFDNFGISFTAALPVEGQVEELEKLLDDTLPCNLTWSVTNEIVRNLDATVYAGNGTVTKRNYVVNTLEVN